MRWNLRHVSSIESKDGLFGSDDIMVIMISGARPARPDEPVGGDMNVCSITFISSNKARHASGRLGACYKLFEDIPVLASN